MKFTCLRDNLKEGINITERVIDKQTTLPILEYFLLKIDKGQLVITSTNLEIGIQTRVNGKVEEEGEVTVPAKTFSQIISLLNQEKIIIESKNKELFIKNENTSSTLKGLDSEDFPIFPEFTPDGFFTVKNKDIAEALEKVSIAVSISAHKPELSGIFIKVENESIILAATDSFRLAEKKIIQKNNIQQSFIIPLKAILEVQRIALLYPQNEVKVVFNKNQISFLFPSTVITSRLLAGSFPDYNQIIPKNTKTELTFSSKAFYQTLQTAGIIAGKLKEIHFIFNGDDIFLVKTQNPELGEYESQIPIKKKKGDPIAISFNITYLIDIVSIFSNNDVQLSFFGEAKPGTITSPQEQNYFYLVMPLKI